MTIDIENAPDIKKALEEMRKQYTTKEGLDSDTPNKD